MKSQQCEAGHTASTGFAKKKKKKEDIKGKGTDTHTIIVQKAQTTAEQQQQDLLQWLQLYCLHSLQVSLSPTDRTQDEQALDAPAGAADWREKYLSSA